MIKVCFQVELNWLLEFEVTKNKCEFFTKTKRNESNYIKISVHLQTLVVFLCLTVAYAAAYAVVYEFEDLQPAGSAYPSPQRGMCNDNT